MASGEGHSSSPTSGNWQVFKPADKILSIIGIQLFHRCKNSIEERCNESQLCFFASFFHVSFHVFFLHFFFTPFSHLYFLSFFRSFFLHLFLHLFFASFFCVFFCIFFRCCIVWENTDTNAPAWSYRLATFFGRLKILWQTLFFLWRKEIQATRYILWSRLQNT